MKFFHRYISVLGLGKLGLPLLAAVASRGYQVIGYDVDPRKIESCRRGRIAFEPGLSELLHQNKERIKFTSNLPTLTANRPFLIFFSLYFLNFEKVWVH
jgi:UDP-N-acetyl-D-mannosaminuronate dehydrogenase